jgi:uncharacterized protein
MAQQTNVDKNVRGAALSRIRAEKDRYFAADPHSPLTMKQLRSFHGLHYFSENPALQLEVTVEPITGQATMDMQVSTGGTQSYRRFGRFKFVVEGEAVELTIFTNGHGYFLPFVDALAGSETYSAGRHLEPHLLDDGHFLVDFNYAYNPYCAYNDRWSCPITPPENRLRVAIRAGEKVYPHS